MIFSPRKKNFKEILVLDIGTSSASVLLLRAERNGTPEVLASFRSKFRLLENLDVKSGSVYIKKAVTEALEALKTNRKSLNPDMVFVGLSSPWFISETRFVRVKKEPSFLVTDRILSNLVSEEVKLFESKADDMLSFSPGKLRMVESKIMQMILNGYSVPDARGKRTRELKLSIYISLAPIELLDEIEHAINRVLGNANVNFGSTPAVLCEALKDRVNCEEGFVVTSAGGEITEVFLVKNCVMKKLAVFLRGGNSIVRRLSSGLQIGPDEAAAFLAPLSSQGLKEPLAKEASQILDGAASDWKNFFVKTLEEISGGDPLPQTLVLLGGAAGINALKDKTASEEMSRFTILGRPFKVVTFMPNELELSFSSGVAVSNDARFTLPLLLALAYIKDVWK